VQVQAEIEQHFGISDPDGAVMVEASDLDGGADRAGADVDEDVLRETETVAERLAVYRDEGLVTSVVSPAALLPSRSTQAARLRAWTSLPRASGARELESALERAGFNLAPFAPAIALLRAEPEPFDALRAPLPGLELLFERHVRNDGRLRAVLTSFAPRDREAMTLVAERLPREMPPPKGVRLTVTGRPLMERELHRTMRFEVIAFLVVTILSNLVLVWLRERSLIASLVLLAVPAGVVVLILGMAGLVHVPITPVNLIVLPLTIGIGVDNCVYLLERVRETGDVREAITRGGRAVTITAATTIAGFGVLGLSRYPGLAGLGMLAAASMALCLVGAIVVLPALVAPTTSRADRSPEPRVRVRLAPLILTLLGIAVLGVMVTRYGVATIALTFSQVRPQWLAVYAVVVLTIYSGYALRWRALLRALGANVPLRQLFGVRLAGLAVGSLTPGAKLGGEPLRAYMLARDGVPAGAAIATVIVDRGLELVANVVFAVAYSAAFASRDRVLAGRVFLLIAASGVALAMGIWRVSSRLRSGESLVPRRFVPAIARIGAGESVIADTDGCVRRLLFDHRGLTLAALGSALFLNALVFAEYACLFAAFSVVPSVPELSGVLLGVGLAHALPVPASVGALEGAQVAVFHLTKDGATMGLVAAGVARIRDIIWTVPGAVYLFVWGRRSR
jgi:uncharacterized protein (TIRG00374 family)